MPSALKDSRACKPTRPMPRYISDGTGRDVIVAFSGDPNPPIFNNYFSESRPQHLPPRDKGGITKVPVVPRFVPDGSGRDLFQQQNTDCVVPVQHAIRNDEVIVKKWRPVHQSRPKATPKFVPSGSGRDLYLSDIDVYQCRSTSSFKVLKPCASNAQHLRPRTSPPPRFTSSGSGRDSYQNPSAFRPSSPTRPETEGFQYGSKSISKNARYRYGKPSKTYVSQSETMKRLCSTTTGHTRAKSASSIRRSKNNNYDDRFR